MTAQAWLASDGSIRWFSCKGNGYERIEREPAGGCPSTRVYVRVLINLLDDVILRVTFFGPNIHGCTEARAISNLYIYLLKQLCTSLTLATVSVVPFLVVLSLSLYPALLRIETLSVLRSSTVALEQVCDSAVAFQHCNLERRCPGVRDSACIYDCIFCV